MALTIKVNGLTLCHKGSGGISTATAPDVCKTPAPGGLVPVPYPNIAFSKHLRKGTKTVKVDGGNPAAIKGSEFTTSTGDEPGTAGGVKSGTFKKEATWLTYSMDVKMEGKNVCRLTDKMLMNHGNTVNMGGLLQADLLVHAELIPELQILCDLMCATNSQMEVAGVLWAIDDAAGNQFPLKAEVSFNMKTLEPYMSNNNPARATRFWGNLPGHRRPDVVITNGGTPHTENIRAVVEMKQLKEGYGPGQKQAYEQIAEKADADFIDMREGENCICVSRVPELVPEHVRERVRKRIPKVVPGLEPVPVPVPVPEIKTGPSGWERAGWIGLGVVAGLAAAAALLVPFDGPAGEIALGSASAAAFAAAFP